jgi:hypothetical protein
MRGFNPTKPVSMWNRAIEAEYALNGENLIRSAFFGSAKEFAEWLDAFDYESGDIFGWSGDSATMEAVESFRKESEYVAVPEFITEFNTNDGSSEIIGADQFHNLCRMFSRDRKNYRIHRHITDDAKVYSVMFIGNGEPTLSTYVWHVPFGADEMPIS